LPASAVSHRPRREVSGHTPAMHEPWEVGQLRSTEETAEQRRIDSAAEVVEGRGLAKGRTLQQNTLRPQSRIRRAK